MQIRPYAENGDGLTGSGVIALGHHMPSNGSRFIAPWRAMKAHDVLSRSCPEMLPWKLKSILLPMHFMMVHHGEPTFLTR